MQVEQKRAFNKLKHTLEPYRSIVVKLDSLLTWEKNIYPAIIGTVVSSFYLMLWMLDMSILTMLSLSGLIILTFDYITPSASRLFFNADNWNGEQEMQFDNVCTQLCQIKKTSEDWFEYLFSSKERKSTLFVIIMTVSFLAMAWIGAVVNNLLLMYFISLGIALYPGIQKRNVINLLKEKCGLAVNSKMQELRQKVKKTN